MTDPVEAHASPTSAHADTPHRLHAMSWLFVLLAQLRQFLVPLVALFVLGRRDQGGVDAAGSWERSSELWPLLGVATLAIAAIWRYFTYRYGIGEDALIIRSGVFSRSLRVVPFARIHNVAIEQSLLHRLFDVALVRLESAGSTRPEAEMRVLSLEGANALEALIRRRVTQGDANAPVVASQDAHAPETPTSPAIDAPSVLLHLPIREVLLQGLLSNRGMIALGAVLAALSQPALEFDRRLPWRVSEHLARGVFGGAPETLSNTGPLLLLTYGAVLIGLGLIALRVLSVALTLLQEHGFTLSLHGRRLTVERGLLSRVRTSISRRRIQSWTLREPLLHRLVGRRSLAIDNAAGAGNEETQHTLRELAPIATPEQADRLIERIAPSTGWSAITWNALPIGHWWRRMLSFAVAILIVSVALTWRLGPWGLLPLLLLPVSALRARREAELARWAVTDAVVAVREGWLERTWRFAELDTLQAVELSRSPLDHRLGTAALWFDTAGTSAQSPPLRLAYLPVDEAERLADRLTAHLARRALRW